MVTLLPGGFLQLLPIVQRVASMHLGHVQEVARGALALRDRRAQRARSDGMPAPDLRWAP